MDFNWRTVLCIGNWTLIGFICVIFPLAAFDLWRVRKTCHCNFWILLCSFYLICVLLPLSTGLMVYSLFQELQSSPNSVPTRPTKIFLLSVKWTTFILGIMQGCILGISAERVYSTIKYKTYEKSRNFFIPIIALSFSLAYAFLNDFVWTNVALGILNFYAMGAANFIIQFLCAGSIFITLYFNGKLRKFSDRANLVLTERYQIHENLRMTRFALPLLLLTIIGIIIAGIINTFFQIANLGLSQTTRGTIYFLTIDVFIFAGFIKLQQKRNSTSRKLFRYFYCIKRRWINSSRVDALGRSVVEFSREEAAHIYFKQLKKTW